MLTGDVACRRSSRYAGSAIGSHAGRSSSAAARWLLATRNRVGGPTFPLTQEFLAQMLGVRRASVSEVASALQERGLMRYTRGVITILDPARMETRACACYRIIRDEFDRMLTGL